jgi:hypothetical protein
MEATKVKKTHVFKDSQGEHIVASGKLLLLRCVEQPNVKVYIKEVTNHGTKQTGYVPFIVAYQEEPIYAHDKIIHDGNILTVKENKGKYVSTIELSFIDIRLDLCKKILVEPDNLSQKHLKAIQDGKLRDGDEVYVECEYNKFYPMIDFNNTQIKIVNHVARLFKSPNSNIIQVLDIQEKASKGNWKVGLKWAFSEKVMGLEVVEVSTDKGDDGLGEWLAKVRGNTKEQAIANAKMFASAPLVLKALLSARQELAFMYNQHKSVTTKNELDKIEATLKSITD